VYQGLGYYSSTHLFHRDRGQEQVKCIRNLAPGNIDILFLGYWNGRSGGWVLR
jgi:hypothetical protein